jgi:hypothetical protein
MTSILDLKVKQRSNTINKYINDFLGLKLHTNEVLHNYVGQILKNCDYGDEIGGHFVLEGEIKVIS